MAVAALHAGQRSESAVRLGNDNIETRTTPPGRVALRRAFPRRPRFSGRVIPRPTALTYLEPGPPGVYHPFASRYFAKLPGVPARCSRKKKPSRGRTTLNVSREKWPSLLNARRASAGSGERHGRERKAPPSLSVGARGRAPRRFAGRARLDDSAANPGARSHCLHASHWIVTSARVGERRATCVSPRVT